MNNAQPGFIARFFGFIWDGINFSRRFIINLVFLLIVVVIISAIFSDEGKIKIADKSALVLDLSGLIVEQKTYKDFAEEYLNEQLEGRPSESQVLLSDVLTVINEATDDPRIQVMVLELQRLRGGGLNKYKVIGDALEQFKASGKQIIAIGDFYSQDQYLLASYADEITLNPMGAVLIDGYGYYGLYYKEALAKLKVTQHVFKVGQYKSAVEPYTRNDMSEQAKQANKAWMDELWQYYKDQIVSRRPMNGDNFDGSLDQYLTKLKAADGDFAQYALDNHWADSLKSREQIRQQLIDIVGMDQEQGFNHVTYHDYLRVVKPRFVVENPVSDKVAVIVARGNIMDGYRKAGSIGGDSTAQLLRQARLNNSVKAVVLRVDSPGGSAFASEIIRKEIDGLQQAGKPVVASMSSVAASGGYWISASADEIWASPTTITGSIGIYGMFMTFENSLKTLGISSDGVATTEMAGMSLVRPLNPKIGDIIQLNIERGYRRFIDLVAQSRQMSVEAVEQAAQGRVWTGKKALELGLVDKLGDLDDAIDSAAALAQLQDYDVKLIEQQMSATDKFYQNLFDSDSKQPNSYPGEANQRLNINNLLGQFKAELEVLQQFNDPQHAYVHCQQCQVP